MWAKFAGHILRRRYYIIALLAIITIVMGFFARNVKMSYEMAQMLPDTDSTYQDFERFKKQFGQEGSVLVIGMQEIELFELENFNKWYSLSNDLKKVEGIDEILSIPAIITLVKDKSKKQFIPRKVFQQQPSTQEELDSLLGIVYSLPFYNGYLYNNSDDFTLMALTLDRKYLDSKDRAELMDSTYSLIHQFEKETGLKVRSSGLPYIRSNNTTKISAEIKLFIVLAILVTSIILLLFFRSFKAMFLSMLIVMIGVVWAVGFLGLFGFEISILTALIPPLIIVIGIPNCIFILNKYHHEYSLHGNQMKALNRVIHKIGNAIFLTNTTTGLGFATFIFTQSSILVEFGIIASLGIFSVFLLSITLMPIMQSFMHPPGERHIKHLERKWVYAVVKQLENIVVNHRKKVYAITTLILIVAAFGITRITVTGNIADDLPRYDPVYLDLKFFESEVNGVLPLEVTVDTKKKNGVFKLSNLKRIDKLQNLLGEYPEFSKPLSIVEGLKFAKQAFYGGDSSKYSLYNSQEQAFIGPYFRGADETSKELLSSYLDTNNQITRITAQVADVGTNRMEAIMSDLKPRVDSIFNPDKYRVSLTGTSIVWLKGTEYLVKNLFISLGIAILLIAFIMSVLFSSVRMVFMSLIPNLLPLITTAAIMGYFGISIKPSTILIFSIAFGISVDDTIHFLAKYRQELKSHSWNIKEAALLALRETGVSMIYTSIVLFFGFGVFAASEFGGTVALGMLVSLTLLVAMCANLILLPSLILSLEKRITTKAFEKESLIELIDEEEDINLEELEINSTNSNQE